MFSVWLTGLPFSSCVIQPFLRGLPDAVGDHVHRGIEVEVAPLGGVGRAVTHFGDALGLRDELVAGRALWAEVALADGAGRVALDGDHLVVLVDRRVGRSPPRNRDRWIWRPRRPRRRHAGVHGAGLVGHGFQAGAVQSMADLPEERPLREEGGESGKHGGGMAGDSLYLRVDERFHGFAVRGGKGGRILTQRRRGTRRGSQEERARAL